MTAAPRTSASRRRRRLAAAAVVVLGLAAAAGGVVADQDRGTEWSPVVYPLQRLPLAFSHARHLGRGTPCENASGRRCSG
ncbi:MAG TPA: hypothetical protein VK601_30840 [Kofleriaceae bacterium]|nr:hypothetical protein [Kofleriaceae bacterium]